MKKQTNTKRALIMSLLSMVLCLTMLIGSTMAWFTDTVTNEDNRIKSGTLKIALLKYNGTEYVDISDGKGNIFNDGSVTEGSNLAAATEWEPGKTEIAFLKVENKGRLSVKYDISLNITNDDTTNAAGTTDVKLTDVLQYAIIDGLTAAEYSSASWNEIIAINGAQIGNVAAGIMTAAPGGKLWPQIDFTNEEDKYSDYFMLAVHMNENATSVYEDLSTTIDVTINATQLPYEEDSFGSEYDADTSEPPVAYELIANGDFETLSGSTPLYWANRNWTYQIQWGDEQENEYLILQSGARVRQASNAANHIADFAANSITSDYSRKYSLSMDINKESTSSDVEIKIEYWKTNPVESPGSVSLKIPADKVTNGWETVTWDDIQIPDGVNYFNFDIINAYADGSGSISIDNISLYTMVNPAELSQ